MVSIPRLIYFNYSMIINLAGLLSVASSSEKRLFSGIAFDLIRPVENTCRKTKRTTWNETWLLARQTCWVWIPHTIFNTMQRILNPEASKLELNPIISNRNQELLDTHFMILWGFSFIICDKTITVTSAGMKSTIQMVRHF